MSQWKVHLFHQNLSHVIMMFNLIIEQCQETKISSNYSNDINLIHQKESILVTKPPKSYPPSVRHVMIITCCLNYQNIAQFSWNNKSRIESNEVSNKLTYPRENQTKFCLTTGLRMSLSLLTLKMFNLKF